MDITFDPNCQRYFAAMYDSNKDMISAGKISIGTDNINKRFQRKDLFTGKRKIRTNRKRKHLTMEKLYFNKGVRADALRFGIVDETMTVKKDPVVTFLKFCRHLVFYSYTFVWFTLYFIAFSFRQIFKKKNRAASV